MRAVYKKLAEESMLLMNVIIFIMIISASLFILPKWCPQVQVLELVFE